MEAQDVWVVWQNRDRTEGRGGMDVLAVCYSLETANRLGKGQDVQGCDCKITKESAFRLDSYHARYYIPGFIHGETKEDTDNRTRREAREAVLEKARSVLTEEEIQLLSK